MAMDYTKPTNTYIRTLYSPGFSSIMLSFFSTTLTLGFVPYLGKDNRDFDQYNKNIFLSTTLNQERAAFFYIQVSRILDGKASEEPIDVVLPCNNGTTLTFEYKPEEDNRMTAYLTINKNNQTIPFWFPSVEYQEIVDGQKVTNVMSTGLATFALILGCYLTGSAANGYLDRYDEILEWLQEQDHQEWEQQAFIAAGGNNQG